MPTSTFVHDPATKPSNTLKTLTMRVDPRRWQHIRAICHRLAGRELSDTDCLIMVTEHYLMKQGLHTRCPTPRSSEKSRPQRR